MGEYPQLPPGQHEIEHFPRFGLSRFARRFPHESQRAQLRIAGDVKTPITVSDELGKLPRVELTADFHCVTTWSVRSLRWSGFRFVDFFQEIVLPGARPPPEANHVILRCQDGYATSLPLADLQAPSVLLADRLDGEPLTVEHGAPLRLVAPAHYGYKNPKHLSSVELWCDDWHYRPPACRFMDHPRARVAARRAGPRRSWLAPSSPLPPPRAPDHPEVPPRPRGGPRRW